MATWADYNKQVTGKTSPSSTSTSKKSGWADFNTRMSQQAISQEARSQNKIDPALYENLKKRGVSYTKINSLAPEKVDIKSMVKNGINKIVSSAPVQTALSGIRLLSGINPTLKLPADVIKATQKTTDLQNAAQYGEGAMRGIRGSSQLLATPLAGALALPKGGASPSDAMKESLNMAKSVVFDKNTSIDKGVEDAAQMWLKNRGVGKYGGKDPDIADVAALGMLGFFNLFGDPAFEYGAGVKAGKALKEFATFKKVGQVVDELPKGSKFLKGTTRELEIPITNDLKVKVIPKENSIVYKGYKKRFPSQSALPEGQLAKETEEIIQTAREATGYEMVAKFNGDDLVIRPTKPVVRAEVPAQTPRNVPQTAITDVAPASPEFKTISNDATVIKPLQPIGTGEIKVSKLATGVEAKAVENKLTKGFDELPSYQQVNMKEQAQKAVEILNNDQERAFRIAFGNEVPPPDLLPESVFTAVEEYAIKNGDTETLRKLASSNLTTEATAMGQRIRALAERNPDSPVAIMQEVVKRREAVAKTKLKGKAVKQAQKETISEIKSEVKKFTPREKDWESFIEKIKCNY